VLTTGELTVHYSKTFKCRIFLPFLLGAGTMPETRTVKISKETYAQLSEIAGELQIRLKRPVSLDEALKYLISLRGKGTKITDLAGSYDISDKELAEIKASLSEAWKRWRLPKSY